MESKIVNRGDRNKIYLLIIVIIALVGTNGYLYFKDKKQTEKTVSVSSERDKLKLEVEKIEVELDKVTALNLELNSELVEEQTLARTKIAELKKALAKGEITQKELDRAYREISSLKVFVKNYNEQIENLQKENELLKVKQDSLIQEVKTVNEKATNLTSENTVLSAKVKTASALKLSDIKIVAYKQKSSGKKVEVTRSSTAKILSVSFNIVPNELAEKGPHNVFLRVFDPAGNLLANENNKFEANGQEMQYSHSIFIDYKGEDTSFVIDWTNPNNFIKGTYSVILYTDGYTMGKTQIQLR